MFAIKLRLHVFVVLSLSLPRFASALIHSPNLCVHWSNMQTIIHSGQNKRSKWFLATIHWVFVLFSSALVVFFFSHCLNFALCSLPAIFVFHILSFQKRDEVTVHKSLIDLLWTVTKTELHSMSCDFHWNRLTSFHCNSSPCLLFVPA